MSTMAKDLSQKYDEHRMKKKASIDYAEELSKVFKKGKIKRILPFFSS